MSGPDPQQANADHQNQNDRTSSEHDRDQDRNDQRDSVSSSSRSAVSRRAQRRGPTSSGRQVTDRGVRSALRRETGTTAEREHPASSPEERRYKNLAKEGKVEAKPPAVHEKKKEQEEGDKKKKGKKGAVPQGKKGKGKKGKKGKGKEAQAAGGKDKKEKKGEGKPGGEPGGPTQAGQDPAALAQQLAASSGKADGLMAAYLQQNHGREVSGQVTMHGAAITMLGQNATALGGKIPKPAHPSWAKNLLTPMPEIEGLVKGWKADPYANSKDGLGKTLSVLHKVSVVVGTVASIAGKVALVGTGLGLILSLLAPPIGAFLLAAARIANIVSMVAVGIDFVVKMASAALAAVRIAKEKNPEKRLAMAQTMKDDIAVGVGAGISLIMAKMMAGKGAKGSTLTGSVKSAGGRLGKLGGTMRTGLATMRQKGLRRVVTDGTRTLGRKIASGAGGLRNLAGSGLRGAGRLAGAGLRGAGRLAARGGRAVWQGGKNMLGTLKEQGFRKGMSGMLRNGAGRVRTTLGAGFTKLGAGIRGAGRKLADFGTGKRFSEATRELKGLTKGGPAGGSRFSRFMAFGKSDPIFKQGMGMRQAMGRGLRGAGRKIVQAPGRMVNAIGRGGRAAWNFGKQRVGGFRQNVLGAASPKAGRQALRNMIGQDLNAVKNSVAGGLRGLGKSAMNKVGGGFRNLGAGLNRSLGPANLPRTLTKAYFMGEGAEHLVHGVAEGDAFLIAAGLGQFAPGHRLRERFETVEATQWFLPGSHAGVAREERQHRYQEQRQQLINKVAKTHGPGQGSHSQALNVLHGLNARISRRVSGNRGTGSTPTLGHTTQPNTQIAPRREPLPAPQTAPATPDDLVAIAAHRATLAAIRPQVDADIAKAKARRQEATVAWAQATMGKKEAKRYRLFFLKHKKASDKEVAEFIAGKTQADKVKKDVGAQNTKLKDTSKKAKHETGKGNTITVKADSKKKKALEEKKAHEEKRKWDDEYRRAGFWKRRWMNLKSWAKSVWGFLKKAAKWVWDHTLGPLIHKAKELIAKAINGLTNIIMKAMLQAAGLDGAEADALVYGEQIEKKGKKNKEAGEHLQKNAVYSIEVGENATKAEKASADEVNRQGTNIQEGNQLKQQINAEDAALGVLSASTRSAIDNWRGQSRPYFEEQVKAQEKAASPQVTQQQGSTQGPQQGGQQQGGEPLVQPQDAADVMHAASIVEEESLQADREIGKMASTAVGAVDKTEDDRLHADIAEAKKASSHGGGGGGHGGMSGGGSVSAQIKHLQEASRRRKAAAKKAVVHVKKKHGSDQADHRSALSQLKGSAAPLAGQQLAAVEQALLRIERGIAKRAQGVSGDRDGAVEAIRQAAGGGGGEAAAVEGH